MAIVRFYTNMKGALAAGDNVYRLGSGEVGRLSHQGMLRLNTEPDTRVLLISGESIVHYGPFVMNTMTEVR